MDVQYLLKQLRGQNIVPKWFVKLCRPQKNQYFLLLLNACCTHNSPWQHPCLGVPFRPITPLEISKSQVLMVRISQVLWMWHKSLPSTTWAVLGNLPQPGRSISWAKQKQLHILRVMLPIWAYLAETFGTRERNCDAGEGLVRPQFRIHLWPIETLHKAFNSAFQVFSVKEEQWDSSSQMEMQQPGHHHMADAAQMGTMIATGKCFKLRSFKTFLPNEGWDTLKTWGNLMQYPLELSVERGRTVSHPLPSSG